MASRLNASATISSGAVRGVGQVGNGVKRGGRKEEAEKEETEDRTTKIYPCSLRSSYQIVALR